MNKLNGKTALVTGASRGIGRAIALALAQGGAQLLVHYSSNEKEADAVVAEIRKRGGKAEKVGADLRKPDGAHTLAKQVRAIVGDRLDILVANAGISKSATIEDTTVEDFDNLFAVNVPVLSVFMRPTGAAVKDLRQAILLARVAWYCVHWSESKESESAWLEKYEAYNKDQIWHVSAIIPEGFAGGGPVVEIAAQDGRILDMLQTQ